MRAKTNGEPTMANDVTVTSKAVVDAVPTDGIPETSRDNVHYLGSGRWLQVPVREGGSAFTLRWLPGRDRINAEEWARLTDEARATWPLHQRPERSGH
jgi:hypothetical protein